MDDPWITGGQQVWNHPRPAGTPGTPQQELRRAATLRASDPAVTLMPIPPAPPVITEAASQLV